MKLIRTLAIVTGLGMLTPGVRSADIATDPKQFIILDGEIKSIDWSGRQLKIIFHSNDGYDGADWALTGPAPDYLLRMGWAKDSIRAGDRPDAIIRADSNGTTSGV